MKLRIYILCHYERNSVKDVIGRASLIAHVAKLIKQETKPPYLWTLIY